VRDDHADALEVEVEVAGEVGRRSGDPEHERDAQADAGTGE
jgi:hypothetical protein